MIIKFPDSPRICPDGFTVYLGKKDDTGDAGNTAARALAAAGFSVFIPQTNERVSQ